MSSEITFQAGSCGEVFCFVIARSFLSELFLLLSAPDLWLFTPFFSLGLGCVLSAMHQEVIHNEETLIICASGGDLLTEC